MYTHNSNSCTSLRSAGPVADQEQFKDKQNKLRMT